MTSRQPIAPTGFFMGSALILSACSVSVQGLPAFPNDTSPIRRVEWVTDPESGSSALLAVTIRGDGRFDVGLDFPPGIYMSGGSRPGTVCRWQRLAHDPTGTQVVVAAGSGTEAQLIAIKATDSNFSTQFCKPWNLLK